MSAYVVRWGIKEHLLCVVSGWEQRWAFTSVLREPIPMIGDAGNQIIKSNE